MNGVGGFLAWLGLALGIVGMLAAGYAFLDPAGAQMANDADPFGTPPSRGESAYAFVFAAAIAAFSAHALRTHRRGEDDDGDDPR